MTQKNPTIVEPAVYAEQYIYSVRDGLAELDGTTLNAEARENASNHYLESHLDLIDEIQDEIAKLTKALNGYRAALRDQQVARATIARIERERREQAQMDQYMMNH